MRLRRARRRILVDAVLLGGILAALLTLGSHLRPRLDLTAERLHTLSPATEEVLAGLEDRVQLKLYMNRDLEGAEALVPVRQGIEDFLRELALASEGRIAVETVDPTRDLAAARHAEHVGIQPIQQARQGVAGLSFLNLYQGIELRYQDRSEVIPFVVPDELEFAVVTRLASLQAGTRATIGIFSREPSMPPPMPGFENMPVPEGRVFQKLREVLATRYRVEDVPLREGADLAERLAVLVVARPEEMSPREVYELDQYLVRGGHVLVLYDYLKFSPSAGSESIESGLDDWLAGHGVRVLEKILWDEECHVQPVSEEVVVNGIPTQRRIEVPYGFSPVLKGDSLDPEHIATAQLGHLLVILGQPVVAAQAPEGVDSRYLLHSSPECWTLPLDIPLDLSPDNLRALDEQARASGRPRSYPLLAVLEGSFPSRFRADEVPAPAVPAGAPDPSRPFVARDGPGILAVLGDADLFSNPVLRDEQNAIFAENLLDWLAQDESLITLRSRGQQVRRIRDFYREAVEEAGGVPETPNAAEELDRDARAEARSRERRIAWLNVLLPAALFALAGVAHAVWHGWRAKRPYRPGAAGAREEQR